MHVVTLMVWAVGVGLLQGFLHCSGMCGPFVMAFSMARANASGRERDLRGFLSFFAAGHLAHNSGRIVSFVAMGALFGVLGTFVNSATRLTGLQAVAGLVGGMLMIGWAIDEVRTGHGAGFLERWSIFRLKPIRRFMSKDWSTQPFLSGVILGIHPCGLLFAMLVSAAATGSFILGGAVMLAFGLGTIPALLLIALLGWYGRKRLTNKRFSYVAAVLMAASGVLFILRGLAVNGYIPEVSPWLF